MDAVFETAVRKLGYREANLQTESIKEFVSGNGFSMLPICLRCTRLYRQQVKSFIPLAQLINIVSPDSLKSQAHETNSTRVESGSDDADNLGHFFDRSSGSHLQNKLSGCDPDF